MTELSLLLQKVLREEVQFCSAVEV